jgi:cytochrome c553
MKKFVRVAAGTVATLVGIALSGTALADAAAGKAKFEESCADCHEAADFKGKSAADLTQAMKDISSGKMKHKGKVKLSDAEIANVVAHLGAK